MIQKYGKLKEFTGEERVTIQHGDYKSWGYGYQRDWFVINWNENCW